MLVRVLLLFTLLCCHSLAVASFPVKKQVFKLPSFTTFGGKTIKQVKLGWEAYGTLNEDKSNVILITHYFTGNSHAAGYYDPADPTPGYWDSIIGPGKAIDTNRFYVISMDTLANLGVKDPNVVTTGPASIDPDTGKPYGLTFPVVTIRDFVNVQKALLDSLGIDNLYAVVGPSMGSMQAIDWASAYPDKVERMISVIGAAEADPWTTALLERWATPIKLDPAWAQGNYYGQSPPSEGLTKALMFITQDALHPAFFDQIGRSEAVGHQALESSPLQDIQATHGIVNWLEKRAAKRATLFDANHLLYLVRACQLFVTGHQGDVKTGLSNIKAKTLFLPAQGDLLLMPHLAHSAHDLLTAMGKDSQLRNLTGDLGHLDGVSGIEQQAVLIAKFLSE